MRAPLLAALATTQINPPADATSEQAAPPCSGAHAAFTTGATARERARRDAASHGRRPAGRVAALCALLVTEAFKTWGDAVAEVREAIDFLRYYADEAERVCAPITLPGPTGESNVLFTRAVVVPGSASVRGISAMIFMGRSQRRW